MTPPCNGVMLSEAKHLGSLINAIVEHEILRLRAKNDTICHVARGE
jgi:hypothetical protein